MHIKVETIGELKDLTINMTLDQNDMNLLNQKFRQLANMPKGSVILAETTKEGDKRVQTNIQLTTG